MRIYGPKETVFTDATKIGTLQNYTDVLVSQEINGSYTLTFNISELSETNYNLVKTMRIVELNGQLFRIYAKSRKREGVTSRTITALHVISDASRYHIPNFTNMIGVSAKSIIIKAFENTPFTLATDAELLALGLSWVNTATDIIDIGKCKPLEIVQKVIDQIGYGELYIDNYKVALVDELGADTNIEMRMDLNLNSLEENENADEIITRLYPYGKDDLTIGEIPYIDSLEAQELYGIIEGYKSYENITNPSELLAKGQFEFSVDNNNRIDIPNFSLSLGVAELSKLNIDGQEFKIGDRVKVVDSVFNLIMTLRVIKYDKYPLNHKKSNVVLGRPMKNYIKALRKEVLNNGSQIDLKVPKNSIISSINKSGETIKILADRIVLDGVVTFVGLASGETVIDGGWVTTDNLKVKKIYGIDETSNLVVGSEVNAKTLSMLTIRDGNGGESYGITMNILPSISYKSFREKVGGNIEIREYASDTNTLTTFPNAKYNGDVDFTDATNIIGLYSRFI